MKAIRTKDFVVREGDKVDLNERRTLVDPVYGSKSRYDEKSGEPRSEN